MISRQIFDDRLVIIDEMVVAKGLYRQAVGLGCICQDKTRAPLILLAEKFHDFRTRAGKTDLAHIELLPNLGKVGEQSFQDRAFRSVVWAVQAIHKVPHQGEQDVFGHVSFSL